MKKFGKKMAIILSMALIVGVMAFVLVGCTQVTAGGSLNIKADGSGSRTIEFVISKTDKPENTDKPPKPDAVSHKFLKKHGDELQTALRGIYSAAIPDSTWLTVTVDNTSDSVEKIALAFNFSSVADYTEKLEKLVKLDAATVPEGYSAPTLVTDFEGVSVYKEKSGVLNSISDSIVSKIVDTDSLFDITAGGTNPLENGAYKYTKEAIKANDYSGMAKFVSAGQVKVKMGDNAALSLDAAAGINYRFKMDGTTPPVLKTKKIIDWKFNDNLENSGTEGSWYNLKKGAISTGGEFAEGIDGKGYKFDGKTYLEYNDLTPTEGKLSLDTATFSFYYKADDWTITDTGANLVFVNGGLDALSGGALDMGFSMDLKDDKKPVSFLAKGNGSSWTVQDKMQTETFFNNRKAEWHNYITVFSKETVDKVTTSYITLYIDGVKISRMEQYNMAGISIKLGTGNGLNIGGYFEADLVKRGLTGTLDNLSIFDGALSETEIMAIYNANPVAKVYDSADKTNTELTIPPVEKPEPVKPDKPKGCFGIAQSSNVIGGGALAVLSFTLLFVVIKRKGKVGAGKKD